MKLCLGSGDDVLEPRTVSDQVRILEAEAGLSHRCQSVGPSHEDGMGWDAAAGSQCGPSPVPLESGLTCCHWVKLWASLYRCQWKLLQSFPRMTQKFPFLRSFLFLLSPAYLTLCG